MRKSQSQVIVVRCSECCRPLRSASSVLVGIGPRCAAIKAALDGLDDRQRAKALEAIADKAVIPAGRDGVALVVSEDGKSVHRTTADGHCSCDHGVRRTSATAKTCWHPAAVRLRFTPRLVLRRSDFGMAV